MQRNAEFGLEFNGASKVAKLIVDRSRFDGNLHSGIKLYQGQAVITNSTTSGNRADGVALFDADAQISRHTASMNARSYGFSVVGDSGLSLEGSEVSANASGIVVAGGTAYLSNNTIFANPQYGILGPTIFTRENNSIWGNGTDMYHPLIPWPSGGD